MKKPITVALVLLAFLTPFAMVENRANRRRTLPLFLIVCGLIVTGWQVQSETVTTTLWNFTNMPDGKFPSATLVLSGNTLYGTTRFGGSSTNGTIYKINTDGSGYAVIKQFGPSKTNALGAYTNSDGAHPAMALIVSGNTLYGTAVSGGLNGNGTIFAITTNGTGFSVLKHFGTPAVTDSSYEGLYFSLYSTNSDGAHPYGGLVLADGVLYGVASGGSTNGNGVIFKVNTNGTGYLILKFFSTVLNYGTNSDGWEPVGGLAISGNTLYGTCKYGGSADYGTIFAINTNGTAYTVLKTFTNSVQNSVTNAWDGEYPEAALALSGNTLYGTADYGGFGEGTLFKINTDGSGFLMLHDFDAGGDIPLGNIAVIGGGLYGTTLSGYNLGSVYRIDANGSNFVFLHKFYGGNGLSPYSGVVLSGSSLYGTTSAGGSSGVGTVFKLDLLPAIDTPPTNKTVMAGSNAIFTAFALGEPPISFQWFKAGQTLTNDTKFSGVTNTILTVSNAQPADATNYFVVFTNIWGSATSQVAQLTVIVPPFVVVTTNGKFGFLNKQFRFTLTGPPGSNVVISASTNLQNWTPLVTNPLGAGSLMFTDTLATNFPRRFYRANLQ